MRWLTIVVGASACTGDSQGKTGDTTTPSGASCPGPITLDLGYGQDDYTPLAEGDPIPVEPRGGNYFLFPVAGEMTGVGQQVAVSGELQDAAAELVAPIEPAFVGLAEYDAASCTGAFFGVPAVLPRPANSQNTPCIWDGAQLTARVLIEDLTGCDGESCGQIEVTLGVVATADTSGCL